MMNQLYSFQGGIHPADGKELTDKIPLRTAPILPEYTVPVIQNVGAPPKLIVKPGDKVLKGQKIAEPGSFVSVPLHSPTSGVVRETGEILGFAGLPVPIVRILSDGEDTADTSLVPLDWKNCGRDVLKQRVQDAGVVGMGGAAFPCHVKLSPPPEKTIDTLIVNGAECEPYLTADHRLMLEEPVRVLEGIAIVAKILKVNRMILGVESNKVDAVRELQKHAGKYGIEVRTLRVRYPQGAEKQLIYALTGRKVVPGGLPMDAGCVVQNAGTCAAVADAVVRGQPLIERITTVTGKPVADPGNWRMRIGTTVRDALTLCGGIKGPVSKVILGGPMMGFAQSSLDVPLAKNSSGVLLFCPEDTAQFEGNPCIRCGRCVNICPMNLLIPTISTLVEAEKFEQAKHWYVMDCMECGACAYVCPAHRPLIQHIRRAKTEIRSMKR